MVDVSLDRFAREIEALVSRTPVKSGCQSLLVLLSFPLLHMSSYLDPYYFKMLSISMLRYISASMESGVSNFSLRSFAVNKDLFG